MPVTGTIPGAGEGMVLSDPVDGALTRGASARWGAVQGKALEIGTQGLLVLLLPRLLGPAGFGRLTVGLAIVTLGSAAISLGAPSAFARFVPAAPAARRAGLARTMTLRLAPIRVVQLAIAAGIGSSLVLLAPERFDALDTTLVVLALAVEVAAILGAQVALGVGRTRLWSFRSAARNAVLLLSVPFLFHLMGTPGVLYGVVLSSLAGLACAGWTSLLLVGRAERGVPIPEGAMRYGAVVGVASILGQLTYRGPVLATSVLARSAVETGFAALAGSVAMAVMFAVRELFTVSLPELVAHWGRDREHAERVLRRLGWWVEAAFIPAALAGVLLLERGLPLVAGRQFTSAVGALVPILMLLPLLPLPILGWQGAALRLRPEMALTIVACEAVTFIVTAVLLVPLWGALGASAALFVAVAASSVLTAWRLPTIVTRLLLLVAGLGTLGVLTLAAILGLLR
jgi:O-antigen/teichoic acid export membrane protein